MRSSSISCRAPSSRLKQGAGRLIRDETDRGVLMICDPRLFSKTYGRRILQSLPPMRRTRKEADALEFLENALSVQPRVAEQLTGMPGTRGTTNA